ncbi:hypothetical protein SDC9_211516 [bioreactor metagenome]|uniref:Uncharacterized protein n=1 Tax=bioreactor metagenome TaxID=1076179 RepID=A0A645JKW7_9ZZZZ
MAIRCLDREVLHDLRDKVARTQGRSLLFADGLQACRVVQVFTFDYIALEAQLGIHRHGGREAMRFDQLQNFIGILCRGAWRVVVLHRPFHAPDLQHRGRCNGLAILVGLYGHPHQLAPLTNHGAVDLVPGIDTPVLLAHVCADLCHPVLIGQDCLL